MVSNIIKQLNLEQLEQNCEKWYKEVDKLVQTVMSTTDITIKTATTIQLRRYAQSIVSAFNSKDGSLGEFANAENILRFKIDQLEKILNEEIKIVQNIEDFGTLLTNVLYDMYLYMVDFATAGNFIANVLNSKYPTIFSE